MRQYQAYESKREHMMEFISFGQRQGDFVAVRVKAVENGLGCTGTSRGRSVWRFSIPNSEPLVAGGSSLSMTLVRLLKA
jgi:hypothetical protein